MTYKYSFSKFEKEHMARAVGVALPISTKVSVEICNQIRGKSLARAKAILKGAIAEKTPIKFTRFTNGVGHKRGMGSARYPVKASGELLKLLESAEANAQFKGLNTSELIICNIMAQNAGNQWRYGRHRRRRMKRTTVEVALKEGVKKKRDTKSASKAEPKAQEKKAATTVAEKKPTTSKPAEKKAEVKPTEKKPEAKVAPKPVEKKVVAVKKDEVKSVESKKSESNPVEVKKVEKPVKSEMIEKKEDVKPKSQEVPSAAELALKAAAKKAKEDKK